MYFRRPQCSQRADFPEKPTAGTVVDDLKNCRRCISRAHHPPSTAAITISKRTVHQKTKKHWSIFSKARWSAKFLLGTFGTSSLEKKLNKILELFLARKNEMLNSSFNPCSRSLVKIWHYHDSAWPLRWMKIGNVCHICNFPKRQLENMISLLGRRIKRHSTSHRIWPLIGWAILSKNYRYRKIWLIAHP